MVIALLLVIQSRVYYIISILLKFSFIDKVRHAQNASFDAVIVFNKDSESLEIMSANDDSDIFIPSLFVGQTSGDIIRFDYSYPKSMKHHIIMVAALITIEIISLKVSF